MHIAVLQKYRGKMAKEALLQSFDWIFDNTSCIKIIGFEAVRNRAAIKFIGCLGVDREGLLKNADGQGGDVVIFGWSKER